MMVIELLVVQFMLKSYERFKNHPSAKHEFDLKPQDSMIFNYHFIMSIFKLQNSVTQIQVFSVFTNILLIQH